METLAATDSTVLFLIINALFTIVLFGIYLEIKELKEKVKRLERRQEHMSGYAWQY